MRKRVDQVLAVDAQNLVDVDELFGDRRVDHAMNLPERDASQVYQRLENTRSSLRKADSPQYQLI
jgi:hypothetical protein